MKKIAAEYPLVRVALALFLGCLLARDGHAIDKQQLEQALAKITVLDGSTPLARATGFAWERKDWVVTSLHAMREGATYQVERPNDEELWTAQPIANLAAHDLVLLELRSSRGAKLSESEMPNWVPFTSVGTAPGFGNDVYTVGYYGDTPAPRFILLKIESSSPLEGKIPTKHTDALKKGKIPDVSLPVLHFMTTTLLPGYSGAPLVNENGQLVGIGNGGLEKGAIDISWGIHAQHLNGLKAAIGTDLPRDLASIAQRYSTPIEPERQVKSIVYGPYEFVYKKTRSFAEMLETVDNPETLAFQLSVVASDIDMSPFRYDIYQDLNYGLVIAAPAGRELSVSDDDTLQVSFDNHVIIYDAGEDTAAIQELLASEDIFTQLAEDFTEGDPSFVLDPDTSSCDRSFDGGLLATLGFAIANPEQPEDILGYNFNKVAVKGQLYLAVAFVMEFGEDFEAFDEFVHALTSVHLTSFSNFEAVGEGCDRAGQPALFEAIDPSRTTYGISDWEDFDTNAMDLAQAGLYVRDLEVIAAGGEWALGGVYQPLPVETFWLYGYEHPDFVDELAGLDEEGYQLKDVEISWDGTWRYAGVFQPDFSETKFETYQDLDQLLNYFQQWQDAGWSLIDLEVPWGEGQYFITALYRYDGGTSAYRFGDWDSISAETAQLAEQGWHMMDIETYWADDLQWFAAVYSQEAAPALTWVGTWADFETQSQALQLEGLFLDDLEVFPFGETLMAIGVFH